MKLSCWLAGVTAVSALLLASCASSAPEVGKPVKRPVEAPVASAPAAVAPVKPAAKGKTSKAPAAAKRETAQPPAPATKPAEPSAPAVEAQAADTAQVPVITKKEMKPYVNTRVDSASLGSDLMLSRHRLLMEEDSVQKAIADSGSDADGARKIRVTQGYRIQVYATTDFKDAERKKEDLMASLDESVYVIYEAPYYKIRVGDFADELGAKNLKRKLTDKGYDAWVVQSKVRIRG